MMPAKKILRSKRHIAVDADGRLLMVNLTTADIVGAQVILDAIRNRWLWMKHLFADAAWFGSENCVDGVGFMSWPPRYRIDLTDEF